MHSCAPLTTNNYLQNVFIVLYTSSTCFGLYTDHLHDVLPQEGQDIGPKNEKVLQLLVAPLCIL